MKEFQAIFEDGCVKLIALNKTVSQVPTGYLYIYICTLIGQIMPDYKYLHYKLIK